MPKRTRSETSPLPYLPPPQRQIIGDYIPTITMTAASNIGAHSRHDDGGNDSPLGRETVDQLGNLRLYQNPISKSDESLEEAEEATDVVSVESVRLFVLPRERAGTTGSTDDRRRQLARLRLECSGTKMDESSSSATTLPGIAAGGGARSRHASLSLDGGRGNSLMSVAANGGSAFLVRGSALPVDALCECPMSTGSSGSNSGVHLTGGAGGGGGGASGNNGHHQAAARHRFRSSTDNRLSVVVTDVLSESSIPVTDGEKSAVKTVLVESPELGYALLLKLHSCYDAVPQSNKILVFDLELSVRKAFYALLYNSTRTAMLYNNNRQDLTGILSVTDFIRVLLTYDREKREIEKSQGQNLTSCMIADPQKSLGDHTISHWRKYLEAEGRSQKLVTVKATESLFRAAQLLTEHRIHRIPVVDPENENPLYILTHKRLLKFMWLFGQQLPKPVHLQQTARALGIGTWTDLKVVYPPTPLVDCLEMLLDKGISGVPVVCAPNDWRVIDIYSRFDAIGIAAEGRFDDLRSRTVASALGHRISHKPVAESVVSIVDTDSLWRAMAVLVDREVHRLVVTDEHLVLKGVISLSDIIRFLVLRPYNSLDESEELEMDVDVDEDSFKSKVKFDLLVSTLENHRASHALMEES